MRRKLTRAVVTLVGIAAFAGVGATTAQAADGKPNKIKVASFEQCLDWGDFFVSAEKMKAYHCWKGAGGQWYILPVY